MHLQRPGRARLACPTCDVAFVQNRPQQRFCSTRCRNAYHQKLTPEALHRQIEDLKAALAALKVEHDAIKRHIEARDGVLIP
jgi:protein-arginine kinase activator protein McsA